MAALRGTTLRGGASTASATTGQPGPKDTAARRDNPPVGGGPVSVRSQFASDAARETRTGRCSGRGADTSSRPRSRSARRPCPRRNARRRRGADTAPGSTDQSATPCQSSLSGVPVLVSMDPPNGLGATVHAATATGQARSAVPEAPLSGPLTTDRSDSGGPQTRDRHRTLRKWVGLWHAIRAGAADLANGS
jgi:hypothetical protein